MNKYKLFDIGKWALVSWMLMMPVFIWGFLYLHSGRKATFFDNFPMYSIVDTTGYALLLLFILSVYVSYFKSFKATDFLLKDYIYHIFKLTVSLVINFFLVLIIYYFTGANPHPAHIAIYFFFLPLLLLAIYACKSYTVLRLVWFGNNAAIFAFLLLYAIYKSGDL